jgi:hypothetical protein
METLDSGTKRTSTILVAVFASALVVVLAVVVLWHERSNPREPRRQAESNFSSVPSEVATLSESSGDSTSGAVVFLNNVELLHTARDNQYLARGSRGHHVLVLAVGKPLHANDGAVADVKGTVRRLPSTSVLKKKWKLGKSQLALIEGQTLYVAAEEISFGE